VQIAPICPYCGKSSVKTTGNAIYPHLPRLAGKTFYQCVPCKAWVGCHDGTDKPLGRLADAQLRRAKQDAHAAFDPIWKTLVEAGMGKSAARSRAYAWLAKELGIERSACHIGEFDLTMCQEIVNIVKRASSRGADDLAR
jgi:hypothetical protein